MKALRLICNKMTGPAVATIEESSKWVASTGNDVLFSTDEEMLDQRHCGILLSNVLQTEIAYPINDSIIK